MAFGYDYGLPLGEPVRRVQNSSSGAGGIVTYSRSYSRCQVSVTCNATACRERGPDLIYNCCNASIQNTSTGRLVVG